jgi:syntaxin of plants SYP7
MHQVCCVASVQEWEVSKVKQDKALSNIERGLGTLGELATSMGENLDQQDVLVDAVGEKVGAVPISHLPVLPQGLGQEPACLGMQMDDITKQLKTNNMKIHGLVTQVLDLLHLVHQCVLHCQIHSPVCYRAEEEFVFLHACRFGQRNISVWTSF